MNTTDAFLLRALRCTTPHCFMFILTNHQNERAFDSSPVCTYAPAPLSLILRLKTRTMLSPAGWDQKLPEGREAVMACAQLQGERNRTRQVRLVRYRA